MTKKLIKIFNDQIIDSKIAIAVSGGIDSMALMNLAKESDLLNDKNVFILVVDHDLRSESKQEAEFVKKEAKKLGFTTRILKWKGSKPNKRIQEEARNKRYNLLINFCRENNINNLYLAHHLDDQIETFLFRMFRGSGLQGLTSFSRSYKRNGLTLMRPLIDIPKSELINYAKRKKINWVEDPSNENQKYDRVKLRKALPLLYKEGFDKEVFLKSIKKLRLANEALDQITKEFVSKYVSINKNVSVFINQELFLTAPQDVQLRVLQNTIRIFSGERYYSPNYLKIFNLMHWAREDNGISAKTLGGTIFRKRKSGIILYKEVKKLNEIKSIKLSKSKYKAWDNRFLIKINKSVRGEISYLGNEGVKILKSKKILSKKGFKGIPITALYSIPAMWDGKRLISAPFFDYSVDNSVNLKVKKIDYLI
ncbi:MAG: tRNA lysidine(34) synthetase TilS [Pseudomonadota bacterium]|nr:tRNA lysidine(34) synthetase TilS [Pseudomonadota bacterium]